MNTPHTLLPAAPLASSSRAIETGERGTALPAAYQAALRELQRTSSDARVPATPRDLRKRFPTLFRDDVAPFFPTCLVSGAQTGADRAGLDFALAHHIVHGGFCPNGRLAEDGRIPDRYALTETKSAEFPDRTRRNVALADATVIFNRGVKLRPRSGSALTANHAKKIGRPHVVLGGFPNVEADAAELRRFIEEHAPNVLNVAGSRESTLPGLHAHVLAVLSSVAR